MKDPILPYACRHPDISPLFVCPRGLMPSKVQNLALSAARRRAPIIVQVLVGPVSKEVS